MQLNYGGHQSYMELRVIQLRDSLTAPPLSSIVGKGRGSSKGVSANDSDSDETINDGSNPNLIPKEEGKKIAIEYNIIRDSLTRRVG